MDVEKKTKLNSNLLTLFVIVAILLSISVTFYRTVINKDFVVVNNDSVSSDTESPDVITED